MLGGVLPKLSCKTLHLDLGNTEVAPWDLGKKHVFCWNQGAEICMWTWETALLLYSTMIFALMDSGSLILRFKKNCRSFGLGGSLSIATPNPSHNSILFYILSKYSTKKTYLNYDRIGSFVLTVTSTSRRANGWRGKLSIPFLAWLGNGGYVPRDTNPIRFFLCVKFH